ncbi:conserved hypothetical protein [Candidatus Nitrotoga fabula]|uniref:Uncharacterized protein n=1 Tax=Candidatus Nitrotoga fabula TaxID=2182327 RepID=A0A916BHD0_9PROT|nr:conserved hypothetical protein [Candidatus Nitrotoga fabula]
MSRKAFEADGIMDEREYEWTGSVVLPQKLGLCYDFIAGDGCSNGKIEQPIQKTTWIPNNQSGILQFRRCPS